MYLAAPNGVEIPLDFEDQKKFLKSADKSVRMRFLARMYSNGWFFWNEALRVDLSDSHPPETLTEFAKHFFTPSASDQREGICIGYAASRRKNAIDLYDYISNAPKYAVEEGVPIVSIHAEIGRRMVQMVDYVEETGDKKPFADFTNVVANSGGAGVHNDKEFEGKGLVWNAFCDLFVDGFKLPTKKQIRVKCGILDDDESAERSFRRAITSLGLKGLPEQLG